MTNCKPVSTPMATTELALSGSTEPPDPTLYHQLVGWLQYLTLTHPDLSYAVNRVCQHMYAFEAVHFLMVKGILRYVKSFPYQSTLGFRLSVMPIGQSKKQRTMARSSMESEYKALANSFAEISWLVSLLGELNLPVSKPPILWCDNLGATYLSANPVFLARTKHIEIDFHFVREKVAHKQLQIQFISTHDQVADLLTKPLSSTRSSFFKDKLRLCSRPPSACEGSI
ncbi:hypothetical protein LIER_41695 [Lithospermum erythrorhizon]|uniref:Uncharacterized protein n=1 Tax=Lithospermum erythrorhizon TaxID=34254 RepID=A0AAV3RD04_LITER